MDSFIPDTSTSSQDSFIPDNAGLSGGMNVVNNAIAAFRKNHAAAQLGPIDPLEQTGDTVPAEIKALKAVNDIGAGYGAASLIGGLGTLAAGKIGSWLDLLKAPKAAEGLSSLETPMEAGSTIDTSKGAMEAANKAMSNSLYGKIPKDISIPLSKAPDTADTVINNVKGLPPSFQSNKIVGMAEDIQNLNKADIPTIQAMQSTLKDIARNGDGVEKVYAAQLSDALQQDLESFGKTSLLPSSPQSGVLLDGQASDHIMRGKWVNAADEQGAFEGNDALLNKASKYWDGTAQPLTNSDIPQNLKIANSYYRDMSGLNNSSLSQALDRAALESKANTIFKAGRIDDVNTAKALLGDQGYESAAGQFYNKLVNAKNVNQAMSKYTPEFLNAALGPQRVAALQKLGQFHELARRALYAGKLVAGGTVVGAGIGAYEHFRH